MRLPTLLPPGFTSGGEGPLRLLAPPERLEGLRAAGLDRPGRWQELIRQGSRRSGRGRVARWKAPCGETWILKQLRRGGVLAPLWRERFAGTARPVRNVALPLEAARREIPTPAPRALLLVGGPPGLCRAWLALHAIEGADLSERFLSGPDPSPTVLAATVSLIRRMHDRGLEHRDLNLGNLLVAESARGVRAYLLDLDRAVFHSGPLDFNRRQRALRRLERSYVKSVERAGGPSGAASAGGPGFRDQLYALYAGGDEELASRLDRGRRWGRWLLRWHRLGWK